MPRDYRDYIATYNGGHFNDPMIAFKRTFWNRRLKGDYLNVMYGIDVKNLELNSLANLSLFDPNPPPILLPVGYTSCGNLIYMDLKDGLEESQIFIKLQGSYRSYRVARSLDEFFSLLKSGREPG